MTPLHLYMYCILLSFSPSSDRLCSTVHRAAVDAARDRHSIAFFRCCNFDTLVTNLTDEPDKSVCVFVCV